MKFKQKHVYLIFTFFIFLGIVIGVYNFVFNTPHEPISIDGFNIVMDENSIFFEDITDDYDPQVFDAVLVGKSSEYKIEAYFLCSVAEARALFNDYQHDIIVQSNNHTKGGSHSSPDYCYYELKTDNEFFFVSIVQNTVIFAHSDAKSRESILEIAKELGYYI